MSRVGELPNTFDKSMKLDTRTDPSTFASTSVSVPFPVKPSTSRQDASNPQLPPQMESVRSHTADEIVQMMNKTPLFMTSLEDAEEDNVELEAMRALQYEGTPLENAQSFKEQGNEMVKIKRSKDGKEFYTKAILILQKSSLDRKSEGRTNIELEAEALKEAQLEEVCLINRALCNLELKNYRSTTLDCAAALRYNPKNIKAFYRSAKALLALDKISEATNSCEHGLAVDPENVALKTLASNIDDRAKTLAAAQQKKQKQAEYDHNVKVTLQSALMARNIRLRTTPRPPETEDATIHMAPDPVSPTSALYFPVIILYPLHTQSDFIKAVAETETIAQHLEYIFPLPWDHQKEYQMSMVDLYMETAVGGLVKVGKKTSLLEVLSREDMVVEDGLIKVKVVPKAKAAAWIAELKARQNK